MIPRGVLWNGFLKDSQGFLTAVMKAARHTPLSLSTLDIQHNKRLTDQAVVTSTTEKELKCTASRFRNFHHACTAIELVRFTEGLAGTTGIPRAPFASVFGIPTSTLFLTVAPEYSVIGITVIKTLGILRNSNKIMIRTLGIPRDSKEGTLGSLGIPKDSSPGMIGILRA